MDLSRINPDRLQEYHREQYKNHEDKMSRIQRDTGRKPVDGFMEVITDHMDLDHEERQFLHEEAHNIYNDAFVQGQESRLQEVADEVEGILYENPSNNEAVSYNQGAADAKQIINKHRSNE